jgi:hypothetical protein
MAYRPIRFLFALPASARIRTLLSIAALLAALVAGCATLQNTPQQDYTWAMWENCKASGTFNANVFYVNRVDPNGRAWSNVSLGNSSGEGRLMWACMAEQQKANPYLDWLKTRQASAPPVAAGTVPMIAPTNSVTATGPIMAPVWRVGDEWEYAYKSPSDSGTYVWSVNRIEMLDGVQHYVIKSGTRELLYRASDLASSLERVDGVIVVRHTPARLSYSWPLTPGKTWEQDNREERPVDRQNTNRNSTWTVDAEETVTVPAGTFRTVKIARRNKNTAALLYEMWYAPDVKQWVKIREVLSNGIRERELVSFKLK